MSELSERYEWVKVDAPKTWRPKKPGDEITGFYGGKTVRNGSFGQYEVVLLHVPGHGTFMLSGVVIVQLVDAADIGIGWPLRVIWLGESLLSSGHKLKRFELFRAEGEPCPEGDLPKRAVSSAPPAG